MSRERLDGNDKKVLLIWILAGLLGAGVAYKYFFQAFPEASVQFKVPRAAALEQARQFAISQGARLDGYQSTIIFQVDDTPKTYLEREVGLKLANQMMTKDVHIWYWQTRFFRPLQKEEGRRYRRVRASTRGDSAGRAPRTRCGTSCRRIFFARYFAHRSFPLRFQGRGSQLQRPPQSPRLEFYLGTPRLSRQGRSLPPECDARWGSCEPVQRISESSRSVAAGLRTAAILQ